MSRIRDIANLFSANTNAATDAEVTSAINTHSSAADPHTAYILKSLIDAKADLITATAADTPARLAVGSNNLILTADSSETTGLRWGGTWTSWTPTWNNLTVGNGTREGKYARIGNVVIFWARFTLGSTSSVSSEPWLTPPIQANQSFLQSIPVIIWAANDDGGSRFLGTADPAGIDVTVFRAICQNASGTYATAQSYSSTIPFTWGTNDRIFVAGVYEVA